MYYLWHKIFKPITKHSNAKPFQMWIAFDKQAQTALAISEAWLPHIAIEKTYRPEQQYEKKYWKPINRSLGQF